MSGSNALDLKPLSEFPMEILRLIANYLDPDGLANLAKTCSLFRKLIKNIPVIDFFIINSLRNIGNFTWKENSLITRELLLTKIRNLMKLLMP